MSQTAPLRWDNIEILQVIDGRQQDNGGGPIVNFNGTSLMNEVAGRQVLDDPLVRGFLQELEILADGGYLTYRAYDVSEHTRCSYPYQYLEQVREFALTIKGKDRAKGVVVKQPLPDPAEDDGRAISSLTLEQIAEVIAKQYYPEQLVVFLAEDGEIPLDRLPLPDGTPDVQADPGRFACGVLIGLNQWGSEGRRILRQFIGAWLDDRLPTGPVDRVRDDLLGKLNRQGWHLREGRLVIGERIYRPRPDSSVHSGRPARPPYVGPQIVAEIKAKATTSKLNCEKLLYLVDELNENYRRQRTYASHALLRAILDHVPPILGYQSFNEVANNYAWTKSDRKYMNGLLKFKLQADDALHRQISAKASLLGLDDMPPPAWVNYLLQECADRL